MMGVQAASAQLFYDFCLDDHVPSDHLLSSIDGQLDLEDLRQTLKPFYTQIGRPSIDPELMIRRLRLLYGHPVRAAALRRGSSQSGVSLVLPARTGRQGSRSLDVFKEPPWALSRERSCCVMCSRASFNAASQRGWWTPMDLRSMQASSQPPPTSSARLQARTGSLRRSRRMRFARRANISPRRRRPLVAVGDGAHIPCCWGRWHKAGVRSRTPL
jgi:hypothetical protein